MFVRITCHRANIPIRFEIDYDTLFCYRYYLFVFSGGVFSQTPVPVS